MILASVFGAVFSKDRSFESLPKPVVWIVSEDKSSFAKSVIEDLHQHPKIDCKQVDQQAANKAFRRGKKVVVLTLPATFSERLQASRKTQGPRPELDLQYTSESELESYVVEGIITSVVVRRLIHGLVSQASKYFPGMVDESKVSSKQFERPFEVQRSQPNSTPTIEAYTHSFCGMTIQYLLFWSMDAGLLLLRERRRGIWRRMRASPLSLSTILLGKVFSTMAIALLLVAVTFGFGYIVFGLTIRGSLLGFVLMSLAMSLLSACAGLVVAAVGGTETRSRSISILVILGMSMLGGLWVPSFVLPDWVLRLSLCLPTSWAMQGFSRAVRNGDVLSVLLSVGMLMIFSVVFLGLAIWRFRWSEGCCEG